MACRDEWSYCMRPSAYFFKFWNHASVGVFVKTQVTLQLTLYVLMRVLRGVVFMFESLVMVDTSGALAQIHEPWPAYDVTGR
jgi:hypothetical protein